MPVNHIKEFLKSVHTERPYFHFKTVYLNFDQLFQDGKTFFSKNKITHIITNMWLYVLRKPTILKVLYWTWPVIKIIAVTGEIWKLWVLTSSLWVTEISSRARIITRHVYPPASCDWASVIIKVVFSSGSSWWFTCLETLTPPVKITFPSSLCHIRTSWEES